MHTQTSHHKLGKILYHMTEKLSIREIAQEIRANWRNINFAAKPYLEAMFSLESISDKYGSDSGKSIVAYFLANAQTWKGEVAREIKKELNKRIK